MSVSLQTSRSLEIHSTAVSLIVLIAAPDRLEALTSMPAFSSAEAFPEAEALRALDVITRTRPSVVALERTFASSSRGTALINRIKADPALGGCEIRIVAAEGPASNVAPPTAAPAVAPPSAPLDQKGTRRAPRARMVDGVEATIDGNSATVVDLSVVGAMVVSPSILRPNQRIRFSLPDPARPQRVGAVVAWAAFEMPKSGPRYRAGIEFLDADTAAMARFIDAHRKT